MKGVALDWKGFDVSVSINVCVRVKYMSVATDQFSLEIRHEKSDNVIFWSLLYMCYETF